MPYYYVYTAAAEVAVEIVSGGISVLGVTRVNTPTIQPCRPNRVCIQSIIISLVYCSSSIERERERAAGLNNRLDNSCWRETLLRLSLKKKKNIKNNIPGRRDIIIV